MTGLYLPELFLQCWPLGPLSLLFVNFFIAWLNFVVIHVYFTNDTATSGCIQLVNLCSYKFKGYHII